MTIETSLLLPPLYSLPPVAARIACWRRLHTHQPRPSIPAAAATTAATDTPTISPVGRLAVPPAAASVQGRGRIKVANQDMMQTQVWYNWVVPLVHARAYTPPHTHAHS